METTIQAALVKGVEMHTVGNFDLASELYESVIKLQPNHADANHNMGLLKLDRGLDARALPYFQTALQADTSVTQFWLSYIRTLIKLDRLVEAAKIVDLAKESGIDDEEFVELHQLLNNTSEGTRVCEAVVNTPSQSEPNVLDSLKLYQAFELADEKINHCDIEAAKSIYEDILKTFPKNKRARQSLAKLYKSEQSTSDQDPPQEIFNQLLNLYNQGQLNAALIEAEELTQKYPRGALLWNLLGAVAAQKRQLEKAIYAFQRVLAIKPDDADAHNNMGNVLNEQGKLEEAIAAYNKALTINPNYAQAYNNMGNVLKAQEKLEEAIAAYNNALTIDPAYVQAYNNMGNALKYQGKLDEAAEAYNKAVSINPNYADAHNNLGVVLNDLGKTNEALEAYNKVLSLKPDCAEAYCNLGITLKDQGKLEGAIEAYKKALSLKLDFAQAHNNMGIALLDQEQLKAAIEAYNKAISFKPDYAIAYWNLSGTAGNISEAKHSLEKCVRADSNYLIARLTLSALKFYEGHKSDYEALLKSSFKNHPYMRSFNWTFSLPKLPPLHFHRWALFDHMTALSKKDRPFYEFGVWRGEAFRYLIKTFKKGYGFDTFQGLPEDWHNEKIGTYSSDGNVPKIDGEEFIAGKFEDTLSSFFAITRPMASIINFDADLYSSTICALNFSKPVIDQDTILIFDQFIINETWEQDEYKALEEFCANNNFSYEVLAVSFFTKQVAVKIIGI